MPNNDDELYTIVHGLTHGDIDFTPGLEMLKAKILEARLDEIRLSNLTSAIDNVHARYMKNRVIELKAQLQASATTYGGRRIDE